MARMNLNYTETDFRMATFKEITDLLEIHNEMNSENNADDNGYIEQKVNIADIPFL